MNNYVQFGIFLSLLNYKVHTAQSLADKFEVSKKTIYRNVNKLVFAGVPITTTSGKNGGIMLANSIKFTNVFFTTAEVNLLLDLLNKHPNDESQLFITLNKKLKAYSVKSFD